MYFSDCVINNRVNNKNSVSFKSSAAAAAAATVIYHDSSRRADEERRYYEEERRAEQRRIDAEQAEIQRAREESARIRESMRTKEKNELQQTRTEHSEDILTSALEKLNKKMPDVTTEISGNTVNLKYKDQESKAEIPQEYFEGYETDKEKEYLVKSWLYETKSFQDFNSIPSELVQAGADTGFYADAYRYSGRPDLKFLELDKKSRENDIYIGKFEKSYDNNKPSVMHVVVEDVPYTLEVPSYEHKINYLYASSIPDDYDGYVSDTTRYYKRVFDNIKSSTRGIFVHKDGKDVFVPKLFKGEPSFKDSVLLKTGNNVDTPKLTNNYIKKIYANGANLDINIDEVKRVDFTTNYNDNKSAYSYYDKANDTNYLFIEDNEYSWANHTGKIMKQDEQGNIYSRKIIHGDPSNDWEKEQL